MSEENKNFDQDFDPAFLNEPVPEMVQPAKKSNKQLVGALVGLGIILVCIIGIIVVLNGGLDGFGGFGDFGGDGGKGGIDADRGRNEFIETLGGVSETFDGVVSRDSYASANSAAKAFVTEELVGNGKAIVHSVESRGELSDREISRINIPERLLEGASAVEEIEVVYEVGEAAAYTRSGADGGEVQESKTVKVYVIKYGVNWRYFSPLPVTGETINKSYYDSVFDYEQYKNCTFDSNTTVKAVVDGAGEHYTLNMEMHQIIKHANGKIYLEQTTVLEADGEEQRIVIYAYLEENYGRIKCYVKMDSDYQNLDWTEADLSTIGFSSLEELTPFYDQYLDYTYFTKADYGFKLADENARKYFREALMSQLDSLVGYIDLDTMDLDMYAEYYVQEGTLTGMRTDAEVNLTVEEYGETASLEETVTCVVKCYDYGNTVVENPMK